jgi:hypothetical protein
MSQHVSRVRIQGMAYVRYNNEPKGERRVSTDNFIHLVSLDLRNMPDTLK